MEIVTVAITETLGMLVDVLVENSKDALGIVQRRYKNKELVLSAEDLKSVDFTVSEK